MVQELQCILPGVHLLLSFDQDLNLLNRMVQNLLVHFRIFFFLMLTRFELLFSKWIRHPLRELFQGLRMNFKSLFGLIEHQYCRFQSQLFVNQITANSIFTVFSFTYAISFSRLFQLIYQVSQIHFPLFNLYPFHSHSLVLYPSPSFDSIQHFNFFNPHSFWYLI